MPKGWKVDHMASALARLEGSRGKYPLLTHPRSFISFPKATPHTNGVELPHLILVGAVDVGAARERSKKRATSGREMRCQNSQGVGCGIHIFDEVHETAYNKAEMHHLNSKLWNRCWCDANLEMWCRGCHSAAHKDGRLAVSA